MRETRLYLWQLVLPKSTGGEACSIRMREKEGFNHPSLWRAPCFSGIHVLELNRPEFGGGFDS
ncbi:MAG: hypothetical protein CBARDMAM_2192 [uncultured Caballeronia sp.]|nr:MAG: hypothetical protein CBARDMAM_2192 [uncultured Caballeronia sp.]